MHAYIRRANTNNGQSDRALQLSGAQVVTFSTVRAARAAPSKLAVSQRYVFPAEEEEEARALQLRRVSDLIPRLSEAVGHLPMAGTPHTHKEFWLAADTPAHAAALAPVVARYLAEMAPETDAALRAFFREGCNDDDDEHIPTVALWTLAAVGALCPRYVLPQATALERETFAEGAHAYFTALRSALYLNRPEAFYARRGCVRRVGAALRSALAASAARSAAQA